MTSARVALLLIRLTALAVVLLIPARVEAIGLGIDVGAGAWVLEGPQADVHVRVDHEFFEMLKVGIRPGLAVTSYAYDPALRFSMPLDAFVKIKLAIIYLEVLGGIYWMPTSVDPIRAHLAGGVGLQIWKFLIGVEVGYLQPTLNVLGRVGFTFF